MVPDGATLVIGGLMEDEDDFGMQGLPGLSRIPVLGYLFGARQKTEGRRELVVLLTPHIWSPDLAMAHAPTPDIARRTQSGAAAEGRRPPPSTSRFQPQPRQQRRYWPRLYHPPRGPHCRPHPRLSQYLAPLQEEGAGASQCRPARVQTKIDRDHASKTKTVANLHVD